MKVKGFCSGKSFLLLLAMCLFLLLGTYKTGNGGINGFDGMSADRTSENASIINTTMKAPFHHSTPTLSPVPSPSSQPTSSPEKECMVYGTVNDSYEDSLEGVTVTIEGEGISESTETDEDGYYDLPELAPGDYTLTYELEGYVTQTKEISFEKGEEIDLGTVTMSQMCSIYGYAVNVKEESIKKARLRLKGIGTKFTETKYSDADGYFDFTELEAGTYLIIVGKTTKKVKLEEGEQKDVGEIILRRKR